MIYICTLRSARSPVTLVCLRSRSPGVDGRLHAEKPPENECFSLLNPGGHSSTVAFLFIFNCKYYLLSTMLLLCFKWINDEKQTCNVVLMTHQSFCRPKIVKFRHKHCHSYWLLQPILASSIGAFCRITNVWLVLHIAPSDRPLSSALDTLAHSV